MTDEFSKQGTRFPETKYCTSTMFKPYKEGNMVIRDRPILCGARVTFREHAIPVCPSCNMRDGRHHAACEKPSQVQVKRKGYVCENGHWNVNEV